MRIYTGHSKTALEYLSGIVTSAGEVDSAQLETQSQVVDARQRCCRQAPLTTTVVDAVHVRVDRYGILSDVGIDE